MSASPSTIPYTGGTVDLTGTDVGYPDAWLMQVSGPPAVSITASGPCITSLGVCTFSDPVELPFEKHGAIYTFALYPWVSAGGSGTPAVVTIVQEDGGP
jgi:hypothetical protein